MKKVFTGHRCYKKEVVGEVLEFIMEEFKVDEFGYSTDDGDSGYINKQLTIIVEVIDEND